MGFIPEDYTKDLSLDEGAFGLLVSLHAGFVSEHCTQYLRPGAALLVNPSHCDAAMASIDPRYRLTGVILSRAGGYRVRTTDLDEYLVPKSQTAPTPAELHQLGRGISYTKSAFAYLFTSQR